jgi:hypothetical protein
MSLSLISEVWEALRQHIQVDHKSDAADTLVNLLVDSGFDPDEIKQDFRGDKDIANALLYYTEEEEIDEEYDEESDDDEW